MALFYAIVSHNPASVLRTASIYPRRQYTKFLRPKLIEKLDLALAVHDSNGPNRFRPFYSSARLLDKDVDSSRAGKKRRITFIDGKGHKYTTQALDGDNLLDIAQANNLNIEGACGGACACSTCHVIVAEKSMYDKMKEPEDAENDLLDLTSGLTDTSRLGCQVQMSRTLEGLVVRYTS